MGFWWRRRWRLANWKGRRLLRYKTEVTNANENHALFLWNENSDRASPSRIEDINPSELFAGPGFRLLSSNWSEFIFKTHTSDHLNNRQRTELDSEWGMLCDASRRVAHGLHCEQALHWHPFSSRHRNHIASHRPSVDCSSTRKDSNGCQCGNERQLAAVLDSFFDGFKPSGGRNVSRKCLSCELRCEVWIYLILGCCRFQVKWKLMATESLWETSLVQSSQIETKLCTFRSQNSRKRNSLGRLPSHESSQRNERK